LGLLFFSNSSNVVAQSYPSANCHSNQTAVVNKKGWPQQVPVSVYIDPAIVGLRRNAVITAFDNWTQSRALNGSQVSYQIVSQAPPAGTGYRVLNQSPASGDRATTFTFINSSGNTTSATTELSPDMTNADAALEAMSHEIGHPAGFGHCDSCAPSESVMATRDQYDNFNDVIGRATTPTPCDNEKLYAENYNACPPTLPAPGSGWEWNIYSCSWVAATPTPTPTPLQSCQMDSPCYSIVGCIECNWQCDCTQIQPTPILIDVLGNGFNMTNAQGASILISTSTG
jgi:hypothetical protein